MVDASARSTVIVVRVWREGDGLRARLIIEGEEAREIAVAGGPDAIGKAVEAVLSGWRDEP